jgi:predicted ATP-dependent endonuclease of OLD family
MLSGMDFSDLEISLLNLEQPFTKSFLSFRQNTNQVELDGSGSGISVLISLVLLEQVSVRSAGDIILLIDEPEMHLHPQLQVSLYQHIMNSAAQTIFTTHSPLMLDLAEWRGISRIYDSIVCPRDVTINEIVGGKKLKEHLDEIRLFHYHETTFTSNDNEIFFAKKVLLVEGPVEKYGLPRLAKIANKSFDGVTIVSCNGKSKIPHYASLCHAYEIPTFVLFDLDNKDFTDIENERILEASRALTVSYFASSFEDLLNISDNTERKASRALSKIDQISAEDNIPKEIRDAITQISVWLRGELTI